MTIVNYLIVTLTEVAMSNSKYTTNLSYLIANYNKTWINQSGTNRIEKPLKLVFVFSLLTTALDQRAIN